MTRLTFILTFIIAFNIAAYSQKYAVNFGCDTINPEKKRVAQLWIDYLKSKPDSIYNNPYWSIQEKNKYKCYDFLKSEGFINPSLYYFNLYNEILSISEYEDGYLIRSAFHYSSTPINIMAITNVVARKENGKYVLANYTPYYTSDWNTTVVGLITYRYFSGYKFNSIKAKEANEFLQTVYEVFELPKEALTYYITRNCDDIHRAKGFDFVITMGGNKDCGFIDDCNNTVYATALAGENHQHELIHIVNKHYPNAHDYFLVGISSYWGGDTAHGAKPLIYHIKRLNNYLIQNSHINLNYITSQEATMMDFETNPMYVYGALLIDIVLRKSGINELKRLMSIEMSDEELISYLRKELNTDDLNQYFRNRLNEINKNDKFESVNLK
jgi:hypothetical protein